MRSAAPAQFNHQFMITVRYCSILSTLLLSVLISLIPLINASSFFTYDPSVSDILEMEQPLLGGGAQESFDSGEFRRFIKGLEYVEESDSNTSSEMPNSNSLELKSVDKSVVPRFKVEAGFIICIGTFLIKLAWPLHNTLNLLFSIIVFAILIYKTELFFGFVLSGCCPIRFKEIEAGPKAIMVSYS